MMRSCNVPPCPALAPYVMYYSVVQTGQMDGVTIVGLPAGSVQLTINFGPPVPLVNNGAEKLSTSLLVTGPSQRSDFIRVVSGIDAVNVVFQPGCAGLFLDMPTAEFTGQLVDAEALWSAELSQMCYDLEGLSVPHRIGRLETLLLSLLNERLAMPPSVRRALELTERAHGKVRIRDLADDIGVSERTLQRRMTELVGLTPKQLARVLRMRHTAKRVHRTPEANWAELALECGFYDQAHLTNEMVSLTGHTPSEFTKLDDAHGFFLKAGRG